MSSLSKYRVHEVAKDFKLSSKDITEILTEYSVTPKNHMQALTDLELNIIFDKLTQDRQIDSIELVFAETYKPDTPEPVQEPAIAEPEPVPVVKPAPESEPERAAKSEPERAAKSEPERAAKSEPAIKQEQTPIITETPETAESKPLSQTIKPQGTGYTPKKEKTVKIIDTRGGVPVNLNKYDERVERLVPERAQNMQHGKEKWNRKGDNKKQSPSFSQKRRQEEQEKMRRLQLEIAKKTPLKVMIPDHIAVGELAVRLKKTGADVVKRLMKLGVMASVSEIVDYDTAALVAMEFGARIEREVVVTIEERLIDDTADNAEDLVPRSPVVVVMGHVDHGKTSLLDAIRETNVVTGEAGGITQHIGAYQVEINNREITFLDTPGHEAFTSMRARGAQVTDIAILVVAADDGIMPQTIEAINHAKAAEIPILVAINKMDKPDASPDRIMQQLTEHALVPEAWGGDVIVCPVSALTRDGLENLLEMVLITADMSELKANPNRLAKGTVIEARLDKGRGPVTTVLVQNGTLKSGDVIIAGKTVGRVRAMTNDKGERVETAGPSVPVSIVGLNEVPGAGDLFYAVEDERMARELVEQRKYQEKEAGSKTATQKITLEDLFSQIQEGQIKDLNIIVKADVHGSAEAIKASLEKISNPEVRVRVIHSGVGAISESDILLATTSNAIVVGFNVRPDAYAAESAARSQVDVRTYRIIYECIEEIEAAMKGMLAPKYKEAIYGHAQVRQTYKVSSIGTIAGCYVQDGKITRSSKVRLVRDGIVIHEGELASLKRFKDDVREVNTNYECGLSIEKYNDIKEGDIIEAFGMEQIKE